MLMKVFAKLGAGNGVGERAILLACHHQTTAQSAPSGLGVAPQRTTVPCGGHSHGSGWQQRQGKVPW